MLTGKKNLNMKMKEKTYYSYITNKKHLLNSMYYNHWYSYKLVISWTVKNNMQMHINLSYSNSNNQVC